MRFQMSLKTILNWGLVLSPFMMLYNYFWVLSTKHVQQLWAIIFSIFIFFNWVPLEKNIYWLYLTLLGFAGFVSHSLIIYAIQLSNLSFVTNFQYSQLVWSTIINFIIFGVPFDYNKIIGVIGIIIFGIMFIRTEGKKT